MSEIVIQARDVKKRYGKGATAHEALRGVSLEVRKGELLMLAGPSGSGKTTLLSILGCILRPTEGEVRLLGDTVSDRPERELPALRLERVGFVFQGGNLIDSLPAIDNVAFLLRMRGRTKKQARSEARALLDRLGVGDRAGNLPKEMSGGQRQRVAIARALAGAPPVLLADEPTASLDAESGLAATTLLREMTREGGHTAIVVTHDSRIFHLADRIVHIDDGRIIEKESRHDEGANQQVA